MNTKDNRLQIGIDGGPNRERLMDVFRMQYLDKNRPSVTFQLVRDYVGDGTDSLNGAILRVKVPVIFQPNGLLYEDGSGESFCIEGFLYLNDELKSGVYVNGYFNTKSRKGYILINPDTCNAAEFQSSLNNQFFAKIEEWERAHGK